jgi:AcrR family transcriptional regulator
MARVVKEEEYAVRRNEILNVAERFIYTKGYAQMSIQDILDAMLISKGAFYHYFDSKQALLEALIDRITTQVEQVLTPIVEDPDLPALDKMLRYFQTAARWKAGQKDYLLQLLRVWYDDHNAIVRQKVFGESVRRVAPILAVIIRQGMREGTFKTVFPEYAGEIIMSMFQSLSDSLLARLLLSPNPDPAELQQVKAMFSAYNDAIERVLGVPAGSLPIIDPNMLDEWAAAPVSTAAIAA